MTFFYYADANRLLFNTTKIHDIHENVHLLTNSVHFATDLNDVHDIYPVYSTPSPNKSKRVPDDYNTFLPSYARAKLHHAKLGDTFA